MTTAQIIPASSPVGLLPFVRPVKRPKRGQPPTDFWSVERTGHWGEDCERGALLARQTIQYIQQTKATPILGHIIDSMVRNQTFDGVECGFLQVIAERIR